MNSDRAIYFIPVYNQRDQLPTVLREIEEARLAEVEFLLVDNGSTDGSGDLVRRSGHPHLQLPQNRGVGFAYALALDWALERHFPIFGTIAANAKMLPAEIPSLLCPIRARDADYVTGSRFLKAGCSPHLPRFRHATIPLVNGVVWATTGRRITDATNGFRAFRLDIMRRAVFDWHADWLHGYSFEYFLYAKALLDHRIRSIEVPTTMRYPRSGKYSHIRPVFDWFWMIWPWVRARLDRRGFVSE